MRVYSMPKFNAWTTTPLMHVPTWCGD